MKQTEDTAAGRVLVVDDNAAARHSVADILSSAGHIVDCCSSAVEAVRMLGGESYDLVITDLQMPAMSGLDLVKHIERRRIGVQTVMVTAHASVPSAVEAMRHGAYDYIEKPFDVDRLEQLARGAIGHGRLLDEKCKLGDAPSENDVAMIGSSRAMTELRARIAQVAPTDETVLIAGESGTGKELVARSIHAASNRSSSALVSLNCPVLSDQLTESELFGHERGAFTGAEAPRTGRFELADGGTLFLDEISEIALPLQAKLLRVLQEQCFERVGSSKTIRVDVRVLATTNRDLMTEIARGAFREDLYYRLAVVPIALPPLRDRAEDIPELTAHFLERAASRLDKPVLQLDAGAKDLLANYRWPGNVRELENIVTRASVLCPEQVVGADRLRGWLIEGNERQSPERPEAPVGLSLEQMERKLIEATLERFEGHRAKTAEALGIGIRTLSGKLRSYGYAPRERFSAKAA